ncbi:MAG TPA: BON domain-containing protein, partial [Polyangiaceae bacterium]|nr:BON domain-containing protein [Polyangiaceae bacterium]
GVIRDRRQKHVVENAADSVGGVKDVHNLLRVRRDDEPEPISRAEHNGPQATARGATGSTVNRPGSA